MGGYFSLRTPSQLSGDGSNARCQRLYLPGTPETLSIPTSFNGLLSDRYHILKLIGQGGFGRTFLAADRQPGSPSLCAIKQLFLQGSGSHYPKALQLFHQEAQQLAELGEHPQIPKLLDIFEQDEQIFIVQEWIDGWTLEQEVAGRVPFDEVEVWNVLRELLPVLQYCHDRQIVHRDIKPTNIIRRRSPLITAASLNKERKRGDLILVDFGAAKHLGDARNIHTGTLIGSAEYAAPEQIRGHAVFASDLYSLGVTCLYLLTQMSPFDLYDVGEDEWKWQTYVAQPISSPLKHILSKLLQPATRRRYQSAAEVLADLDALSNRADNQPARVESAIEDAASASRTEYFDFPKQLSAATDLPSAAIVAINSTRAVRSTSSATIYIPETQGWYYLSPETKTSDIAHKVGSRPATVATPPVQNDLTSSIADTPDLKPILLGQGLFKTATKDAVELVLGTMLIFMLTCIGSMGLICIFFEMERRSPTLQPEIQQSLPSSKAVPVK